MSLKNTPNSKNKAIEQYLFNYCKAEYPPKFAVLISGEWGCGKTWFIKERVISQLKEENINCLYVSLYGLSKPSDIDQEIFKELHPNLSNKHVKLLARITKGLIQASLKIDLNSDGKEDGALSIKIPDVNWPEYLQNSDKHILIFDDLERCSIPINELLGYLNYFVEHGDHKLILIANESEIRPNLDELKLDTESRYNDIKEKLIGKTFLVDSDIDQAIEKFIDEVANKKINKELWLLEPTIKKVYSSSNFRNLRHLRQCILEFSELLKLLNDEILTNKALIKELLVEFLIINFETRNGTLKISEIKDLSKNLSIAKFTNRGNEELQKFEDLERKYMEVNWQSNLISDDLWFKTLSTGCYDIASIQAELMDSKFYEEDKTPSWRKLWNLHLLKDDEIKVLLAEVQADFEKGGFNDLEILRHVTGILLFLNQLKICTLTNEEIIDLAKSNANSIINAKDFVGTSNSEQSNTGSYGLGFHEVENPLFLEFSSFIKEKIKEKENATLPEKASALLDLLTSRPEHFTQALIINNTSDCKYHNVPILAHIDPEKFVSHVEMSLPSCIRALAICFRERYKLSNTDLEQLIPEVEWLKKVINLLTGRVFTLPGSIRAHQLNTIKKNMVDGLNHFNSLGS